MKKIILAVFISCFISIGVQAEEKIDLETCSSYYDGCNTCTVFEGKLGACTEMYCMETSTPKCLESIEEKKEITNAQDLCEVNGGEYNEENCNFGETTIKASTLYGLYMDFTGQMMYMGGSKYFNEAFGGNNFELIQSDYNSYLFIKKNISQLYTQYSKEIDAQITSLGSKLNIEISLEDKYEKLLGKSNIIKIDIIVNKLLKNTSGMTQVEKEQYLIKKNQLLKDFRNKYDDKNINGKYSNILNIIDYLYQKIEQSFPINSNYY